VLHEIGSTVAGLVSASRLVDQPGDLPHGGRSAMESLVRSQVERLDRIFSAEDPATQHVGLDEVLRPLVLAQAAQGQAIDWVPSGVEVDARPDDVAEIVRILLDNAARHADSPTTRIDVRRVGGTVEVAVVDDGRGLPDEVRARLFAWGVRGAGSHGQGIGLSHARRLALHLGGYLVLDERAPRGTTFVLGLRAHTDEQPEGARLPDTPFARLEGAGIDEGGSPHELP
jgi:signal transduction histidine kinase